MNKKYLSGLILLCLIFISACTSSNKTNQIGSGNAVQQTQASVGIQKSQTPPDFTIKTIDGRQYTLSDFREQKKPILLYFWASWCPFCSKDFDIVKNIYPKYSDKVTFLAIDLDTGEDTELIRNYKNKKGLEGIDFAEADVNVLSDYAIKYTTTKYAIGKNGAILYKGSGIFTEQQWEILLNGLINS